MGDGALTRGALLNPDACVAPRGCLCHLVDNVCDFAETPCHDSLGKKVALMATLKMLCCVGLVKKTKKLAHFWSNFKTHPDQTRVSHKVRAKFVQLVKFLLCFWFLLLASFGGCFLKRELSRTRF